MKVRLNNSSYVVEVIPHEAIDLLKLHKQIKVDFSIVSSFDGSTIMTAEEVRDVIIKLTNAKIAITKLSSERETTDYSYTLSGGQTGRVQINSMDAPYWYGADLDDDDKADILDALEAYLKEEVK